MSKKAPARTPKKKVEEDGSKPPAGASFDLSPDEESEVGESLPPRVQV